MRLGHANDKKWAFLTHWRRFAPKRFPEPIGENGEHRFALSEGRQYRLDWAWPDIKIGVEIDCGSFMVRRNRAGEIVPIGRHGREQDKEKRNLAGELGWIILSYTP